MFDAEFVIEIIFAIFVELVLSKKCCMIPINCELNRKGETKLNYFQKISLNFVGMIIITLIKLKD